MWRDGGNASGTESGKRPEMRKTAVKGKYREGINGWGRMVAEKVGDTGRAGCVWILF
jgi:hypothetical protein